MAPPKLPLPEETLECARALRRKQTDPEKMFWSRVRNHQILDLKFRRQFPIPPYVVDFFCNEKKMIVELDGGQHTPEKDDTRTAFLKEQGYTVLRYWNHEVLENIEGVIEDLANHIRQESSSNSALSPSPYPSPEGRGKIEKKEKICIAQIMTAHGIRGLVKLRCFLEDPADLESYNPLETEEGQEFSLTLKNPIKGDWLAEVSGISDRTSAEKLRHLLLYTDRDRLPEPAEGEVYVEDLIGCKAVTASGEAIGEIIAVENFGASDIIEIRPLSGRSFYLPMTEPYVSAIDLDSRIVTIDPAEEFRH